MVGGSPNSHPLPCGFPLQILERLNKMCGVGEQVRKKQQRLLKNMDAHKVMLDLLQIPYEKVGAGKLGSMRGGTGRQWPLWLPKLLGCLRAAGHAPALGLLVVSCILDVQRQCA